MLTRSDAAAFSSFPRQEEGIKNGELTPAAVRNLTKSLRFMIDNSWLKG
jgi:hypothetical protein